MCFRLVVKIRYVYCVKVWSDNDKTYSCNDFAGFCDIIKNLKNSKNNVPKHLGLKRNIEIDKAYLNDKEIPLSGYKCMGNTPIEWVKTVFEDFEYFKQSIIVVLDGKVPTVASVKNTGCFHCKGNCGICKKKCFAEMPKNANKPAYYNKGFVYGILPLEPKYHIVINQNDCKHLWPQFDDKNMVTPDGKTQQLVNFFEGPAPKDVELYVNGARKLVVLFRKNVSENVKNN